jgi:hypothetical protein
MSQSLIAKEMIALLGDIATMANVADQTQFYGPADALREAIASVRTRAERLGVLVAKVRLMRCEGCDAHEPSKPWPEGWIQCGSSQRFKTPRGHRQLAAWCPKCKANGTASRRLSISQENFQ